MSILVHVSLQDSVLFPGDELCCSISVTNNEASSSIVHKLSVSAIGKLTANPSWVQLPLSNYMSSGAYGVAHAKKERDVYVLFETPHTVVCSQLHLEALETKVYTYTFTLPHKIPPTYKGTSIKYSYQLVVTSLRNDHAEPSSTVNMPFRVLNPAANISKLRVAIGHPNFDYCIRHGEKREHGLEDVHSEEDTASYSEASESTSTMNAHVASLVLGRSAGDFSVVPMSHSPPMNQSDPSSLSRSKKDPLLRTVTPVSQKKASLSTYYMQLQHEQQSHNVQTHLQSVYKKNGTPLCIDLSKERRHLVKFTIGRTAFQLGDRIEATFDFSNAETFCYQVSVALNLEETVSANHRGQNEAKGTITKTLIEQHEHTAHTLRTHFVFEVPPNAPQTFSTDHVQVSYVLQFEFITEVSNVPMQPQQAVPSHRRSNSTGIAAVRRDPNTVSPEVDCLHWELPIKVLLPHRPTQYLFDKRADSALI